MQVITWIYLCHLTCWFKLKKGIQWTKSTFLNFLQQTNVGPTIRCHTIFPLKMSPEIQWACPFGQIQMPNTKTNTNTKNLKCSVLVVQQSVIPCFHSKFHQKSNGHLHLAKYKSQIQIPNTNPKYKSQIQIQIQKT